MNKVLALFVFLLGISFLGFSQENKNLNNLTSGKWHIDSVQVENEFMIVTKEDNWMVFHVDGTYQIMLDKTAQIGTWAVDEKNEMKFDSKSFDGKSHLEEIDYNNLKFSISGYTLALTKS